ncbi:MAG TPA: 5-(carboxyamino)imidazole ribonucleotide synthase [Acidimicrobiia bacterium]|nr:5-(carboxyamino)imidazole ribonucleotide synthase [Acidimicrobiia bacterium]
MAVLGGGQLGQMLGLAGVPLGVAFSFLDPSATACAGTVGPITVGALDDPVAMSRLADGADVVTYEWEGFAAEAIDALVTAGHRVHPPSRAIGIAQDRLVEKGWFEGLGIDVAPYAPVSAPADLDGAIGRIGLPAVLKTCAGGYDGKGQVMLRKGDDAAAALATLPPGAALILERYVLFDRELSVLAVRGRHGDTRCWPLTENHHAGGILRRSMAPAPNAAPVQTLAEDYATRLLDDLDYVGVLALELFQVGERLLANEMAPRVHNSGHWTIEGAVTSQFENHVRAVLGWPLGDTTATGVAAMVNCIGVLPDPTAVLSIDGAHLHAYGKTPRRGRKIGHVTVVAADAAELAGRLETLDARLLPDDG